MTIECLFSYIGPKTEGKIIEVIYDFVYVSQIYDKNNKKYYIHIMLGSIWE